MTLGSLALMLMLAFAAFAQDPEDELDLDFDEIEFEDSEEEEDPEKPTDEEEEEEEEPEEIIEEEVDEGLLEFEDPDDNIDLLADDEDANRPEGADSEAEFRATERRLADLAPDEEIQEWEAYLEEFPDTVYRKRIELRIENLMDQAYSEGIRQETEIDAQNREIKFSQGMLLENIDPRSRIRADLEFSLGYLRLLGDYEHQLLRNFSLHGGARVEVGTTGLQSAVTIGPRWAIIKSAKTQTVLSVAPDIRVAIPSDLAAYFSGRPVVAFGQRLGKLDLQAQVGADLGLRTPVAANRVVLDTEIFGGINAYYQVSPRVGLFGETVARIKPPVGSGDLGAGVFAFNTIMFGVKFFPVVKARPESQQIEVNAGVSLPYYRSYWSLYPGSLAAQFNYWLDD